MRKENPFERQIFAELEQKAESKLFAAGIYDVTVHIEPVDQTHAVQLLGEPDDVQRAKEVLGL